MEKMKEEQHKERIAIEEVESMMSGFQKIMNLLVDGKSPEFLEGFFEGMIVMKKIELGNDI